MVFSNCFILDECNRLWEIPFQEPGNKEHIYGVVLGGMSSYDPSNSIVQFHAGSDRLWQTLKLYKCGRIDTVVISGGAGSILHQDLKEADHIESYLMDIDFPLHAFHFENESKNTHENAVNTAQLFEQKGWKKNIVLISSSLHMRRAKACFEKQGFSVFPYVTNRKSGPRKFEFDHLFIPNIEALHGWNSLIHEVVGLLVYQIQGYC